MARSKKEEGTGNRSCKLIRTGNKSVLLQQNQRRRSSCLTSKFSWIPLTMMFSLYTTLLFCICLVENVGALDTCKWLSLISDGELIYVFVVKRLKLLLCYLKQILGLLRFFILIRYTVSVDIAIVDTNTIILKGKLGVCQSIPCIYTFTELIYAKWKH